MAAKKTSSVKNDKLFGLSKKSWVESAAVEKSFVFKKSSKAGFIYLSKPKQATSSSIYKKLNSSIAGWQKDLLSNSKDGNVSIQTEWGPIWLVNANSNEFRKDHDGALVKSKYAQARDLVGSIIPKLKNSGVEHLHIILDDAEENQKKGALVGAEIASYSYYKLTNKKKSKAIKLTITNCDKKIITDAAAIGVATNIGRHLVNIPAGELNPKSYSEFVSSLFTNSKTTKVEIWKDDRLKKEKMGLLRGVGKAAVETSRLVRISYRPLGKNRIPKPIAFVGKGVTFDTGGLDLKPSQSMRLMKKDMGGSATLAGLSWYLEAGKSDVPCDIYLALAENVINEKAMRPGDILEAANGITVEIHNTDAEGRLVLADALHIATTRKGKDEPLAVIDTSTLTGAMRIALGTKISGLCSNHDPLADAITKAGTEWGDLSWRMPLFDEYKESLKSYFADMTNCAAGGHGGGITASLFLEQFINNKKWAHLDFMAWIDSPSGALTEPGGNGQMVQGLVGFLKNLKASQLS